VYYIPNVSLILLYLTDLNYDGSHVIVLGKSRRTCSPDIFAGHSKSQTYWTFRGPDVNNENREREIQVHLRKKPTSCACLLILLASMSNIEIHRTRLFLRMKGIPVAIEHSALTAAPFVKKITPYIHVS
jgi:hypothetical protein